MRFSIVIPAHNEVENLPPLIAETIAETAAQPPEAIIVVDDGSTDGTGDRLCDFASEGVAVRFLRHHHRQGQSAALATGIEAAATPWVMIMDGDGENDPRDIPRLLAGAATAGPGTAMVGGLRRRRQAAWSKRLASRLANAVRSRLLGDGCPDTGCGLKLFRRDAYLALPAFDGMHRFLPALFQMDGHAVVYIDVNDRPRRHGRSHYGNVARGLKGLADIARILRLRRQRLAPGAANRSQDQRSS
jgi:glycosyltransferase involved in cell wall biosynthesis